MSKKVFFTFLIPALILVATAAVVFLGRGYRLDLKKKEVKPTGILVATSDPNGAQVFLNGKFTAATNSNINLPPGWYNVRIHKDGYQDWRKKMPIRGEVVVKTDATLFPANPSLTALTTTGVQNPILSPDGTKIAYSATPSSQLKQANDLGAGGGGGTLLGNKRGTPKSGAGAASSPKTASKQTVYILDLTSRPLSFNKNPYPYPGTLKQLLNQWRLEAKELRRRRLKILPQEFRRIATSSAQILSFSPDETKVLYQATASATLSQVIKPPLIGTNPTEQSRQLKPNKIYVYDLKEDRNYYITEANDLGAGGGGGTLLGNKRGAPKSGAGAASSPKASSPKTASENLFWLPTSRHLILVEKQKISILEYDGTNKVVIYSGPFENSYVFPHPGGNSLIILTTLNPAAAALPNLYSLTLK